MEKTKPQQNSKKFERKLKVSYRNQASCPEQNLEDALPTIRCLCGTKILIIPDSKAMDAAIANHLDRHRRANKDAEKAAAKCALMELSLLAQLFEFAASIENGY